MLLVEWLRLVSNCELIPCCCAAGVGGQDDGSDGTCPTNAKAFVYSFAFQPNTYCELCLVQPCKQKPCYGTAWRSTPVMQAPIHWHNRRRQHCSQFPALSSDALQPVLAWCCSASDLCSASEVCLRSLLQTSSLCRPTTSTPGWVPRSSSASTPSQASAAGRQGGSLAGNGGWQSLAGAM